MTPGPYWAGLCLSHLVPGARGMVGVLTHDDTGANYAITAGHLVSEHSAVDGRTDRVRPGSDLVKDIPVDRGFIGGLAAFENHPRRCAADKGLLGISVYRIGYNPAEPSGGPDVLPGQITAIRGIVKLRDPTSGLTGSYTDLLEVIFDDVRYGASSTTTVVRPLAPCDAGALVVSWDNLAVGIIVAGAEYRALVAPLQPYLERRRLTLSGDQFGDEPGVSRRSMLSYGLGSILDDLAREEPLDLGVPA